MKKFIKQINVPLLLLFCYLVKISIISPSLAESIIFVLLAISFVFCQWIDLKRSTTMVKEDDFLDLHKQIRKAQLEKQLFQINTDLVKLHKTEGVANERQNGKVIF